MNFGYFRQTLFFSAKRDNFTALFQTYNWEKSIFFHARVSVFYVYLHIYTQIRDGGQIGLSQFYAKRPLRKRTFFNMGLTPRKIGKLGHPLLPHLVLCQHCQQPYNIDPYSIHDIVHCKQSCRNHMYPLDSEFKEKKKISNEQKLSDESGYMINSLTISHVLFEKASKA